MRNTLLLTLSLVASTAIAQDPHRREATQLPAGVTTDHVSQVCTPKQDLPALAVAGAVHTGQLVHTCWLGPDASGAQVLYYRRSTTGGCDWEPEQVLWTNLTGDAVDTDFRVLCWGHEVWVLFTTDLQANGTSDPASNDHVWVLASDQQGLPGTWTSLHISDGQETVMSTTDLGADADSPEGSAVQGALHVVWEYDYQFAAGTAGAASNEDVWYQKVEFTAPGVLGLARGEELRLESTPSGVTDTDFPRVVAKGDLVVASWQDCRTPGGDDNLWNDTIVRVSMDGGATFAAEENLTNFAGQLTFASQRESKFLIFGTGPAYSVCAFFEDSRNGDDDIFFMLNGSNGSIGAWTPVQQISRSPVGADGDGMFVSCTETGTIYVTYEDDRLNPGDNGSNRAFVIVDRAAGGEFLNDVHVETELSLGNPSAPVLDCHGNYATVAYVDNISGADPSAMSYTYDFGTTWHYRQLLDPSQIDADQECNVAVTTRGDAVGVWMDDRNGGNSFNTLFAGGLRISSISYDPAAPAYIVRGAGNPGDFTTLMFSLTAPSCGALQLDPANGWQSNYAIDGLTFAALSLPVIYTTTNSGYDAVYPGLPNAATLIGLPVYVGAFTTAAGTIDVTAMTETLLLNP